MKRLIEANLELLKQAADILEAIDDAPYREPAPATQRQRAGAQFRHVLEFYECFLDGLAAGRIDYDARRRDTEVERDRRAALDRIRAITVRLLELRVAALAPLLVRAEDEPPESLLASSVGRELQALRSHTIHHFALIALVLAAWGVAVPEDFGVAPSTLTYRANQAVEAA